MAAMKSESSSMRQLTVGEIFEKSTLYDMRHIIVVTNKNEWSTKHQNICCGRTVAFLSKNYVLIRCLTHWDYVLGEAAKWAVLKAIIIYVQVYV